MGITGLGDATLVTGLAGGVFGGDQPQVRHQRAWVSEAMQIADLGDEGDGGDEVEAAQAHQRLDDRPHPPVIALRAQRLGQALDALVGILDGLPILVEGDLLGRVLEAQRGEMALVRLRPGALAVGLLP